MHYPEFRRNGWPIGSGMVESANKNVVEARLKGAGMHWQRKAELVSFPVDEVSHIRSFGDTHLSQWTVSTALTTISVKNP